MSTTPPEPERIDLTRADDPRDVVHRAVALLAQGEVVEFAGSRPLAQVASALSPGAVERLASGSRTSQADPPLTLLLRSGEELTDWVPGLNETAVRLSRRAWPGPLALAFDPVDGQGLLQRLAPVATGRLQASGSLTVQSPDAPFLRDVLRFLPGPLIHRRFVGDADARDRAPCPLIIQGAVREPDPAPTLVRVKPGEWTLLRPGPLDESDVRRMAGTIILFVCTGNTCRSPMAEALCKVLLAERLRCTTADLESRGYVVLSAGIAAVPGMPAASNAIDVVKARGGSLREHSSQMLSIELVRQADLILTMTSDHLEALLDAVPDAAPRARPLHPQGYDVADPVGADRETYKRTADAIESYLTRLLDEAGFPR